MLVLARKKSEAVVVGERSKAGFELKVTVLEIQGGMVRLGFEAGMDIFIHRWEVWERIRAGGAPDATGTGAMGIAP